jgi:hypothetical protein
VSESLNDLEREMGVEEGPYQQEETDPTPVIIRIGSLRFFSDRLIAWEVVHDAKSGAPRTEILLEHGVVRVVEGDVAAEIDEQYGAEPYEDEAEAEAEAEAEGEGEGEGEGDGTEPPAGPADDEPPAEYDDDFRSRPRR